MTPNQYLIHYNNYKVELMNWSLKNYNNKSFYISGLLENKNKWNTTNIKKIYLHKTYLECHSKNNTIYLLFFDSCSLLYNK